MPKIKIRRGLEANLPVLDEGEPGFTTDTEKFFIGSQIGNVQYAKQSDLAITTDDTTFVPTLAATTVAGNPTYNTRVSKIKKVGNMVHHFVTMNITVDATISGSVYVALQNKPENITNLKVFVPIYQGHGIFTDATIVTGVMFTNNQYLYLQKIVNGVVSNLTGADIQGKTIELTFTAIYTSV